MRLALTTVLHKRHNVGSADLLSGAKLQSLTTRLDYIELTEDLMRCEAEDSLPRAAFSALGLAELYSLLLVVPLIHPRHAAVYHWHASPLLLFLPVFLDLALVWAMMFSVLIAANKWKKAYLTLWSLLLSLTPALVSHQWDLLWDKGRSPLTAALYYGTPLAVLLMVYLCRVKCARPAHRVIHTASTLLMFFGIGATLLLAQLIWFTWQARSLNDPSPLHHPQTSASALTHPRIVWLVLDELSYQQIYERRFPGLQLPGFDALATQSTLFTDVSPAGIFTDRVLPSLISGIPVDLVRASPAGRLSIHNSDTNAWLPFDQHNTIFQDAIDAGYSTATAGWYIPYCRILPAVLDKCLWSYSIPARNGMFPGATLFTNMVQPFALEAQGKLFDALLTRLRPASELSIRNTKLHIDDYQSLSQATNQLLRDPSATFALLHMPIPHLGGIYNRSTSQLSTGPSSYLDNLALADVFLAHLRAVLEQSGQWDKTTLIVMGDHSWRTAQMWKDSTTWTAEEQRASQGGTFDDRPAYIVKLAGQHTASIIDIPFPALSTRVLLKAMLHGKINSPEDLALWIRQHR